MMIEILQLFGLLALICLAFKFFFLHPSPSAPESPPLKPQQPPRSQQIPKANKIIELPQQSIQQAEKQSSEEESNTEQKTNTNIQTEIKVYFEAQAKSYSINEASVGIESESQHLKKEADSSVERRQSEIKSQMDQSAGYFAQLEIVSQQQSKQAEVIEQLDFVHPISQFFQQSTNIFHSNGGIKLYQVSIDTKPKTVQSFEVKDVVSECEEHSIVDEVHSNAYRIEVSQLQMKHRSSKLKIVKEHYKSIINDLKRKLDEVCIRNNESISQVDINQTITFSEEESSYLDSEERGELEMKVEEVANLRNQLQLHEDILTTMIDEDNKLKDQLRSLEEQNKSLKTALQSSAIHLSPDREENTFNLGFGGESVAKESDVKQEGPIFRSELKNFEGAESRIMQLYTSQIVGSNPLKQSILSSQLFPKQSTISMMSLIEGVMSIGMLGECRFLNEISKKYVMNQIKKKTKQVITHAQLIYSFQEGNQDERSIYSLISKIKNLLFLIKLPNRTIAVFTEAILNHEQPNQNQQTNNILLMDLTKRKSFNHEGICQYVNNQITFGSEQGLSQFAPFILKAGEWCEQLGIDEENVTNLAIFEITLQSQE